MRLSVDDGTTVNVDTLTTDKTSILTGKEDVGRSQLGWLTNSTDWCWLSAEPIFVVVRKTYQGSCAMSSSSPCP